MERLWKSQASTIIPQFLQSVEYIDFSRVIEQFDRQANQLILNISALHCLLRLNSKAENMRKVDKLKIMNYRF